jgi:predicted DNA binding CopG/RHH family protein
MKKNKQKLSAEEKAILTAFESGKLRSVAKLQSEKKRIQNIAKTHGLKNRRISLRMTEWDFSRIQEEALKEGLPYQSLLSSIIHKYLTGQLDYVNNHEK